MARRFFAKSARDVQHERAFNVVGCERRHFEKPAGFPAPGCWCDDLYQDRVDADGIGRADVPRVGGSGTDFNGRRVDDEIRRWVDGGLKAPLRPAASRRVAAGLRKLGVRPLKAQVRVTDDELKLTTLIDAVGESVDGSGTMWIVEVKATTLNCEHHNKSYSRMCRRTPMMRNGIPHTEQATHFLQAAFGALAIRRSYGLPSQMRVRACVVVATTDACRVYECPAKFFNRSLFKRRSIVPIIAKPVGGAKKKAGPAAAGPIVQTRRAKFALPWPDCRTPKGKACNAVLQRAGLVRKTRRANGIVQHVLQKALGNQSTPIGVVVMINVPLHKMDTLARRVFDGPAGEQRPEAAGVAPA